jgi:hypothetical protein
MAQEQISSAFDALAANGVKEIILLPDARASSGHWLKVVGWCVHEAKLRGAHIWLHAGSAAPTDVQHARKVLEESLGAIGGEHKVMSRGQAGHDGGNRGGERLLRDAAFTAEFLIDQRPQPRFAYEFEVKQVRRQAGNLLVPAPGLP